MWWSHNYNKRVDPTCVGRSHDKLSPAPRDTLFATRTCHVSQIGECQAPFPRTKNSARRREISGRVAHSCRREGTAMADLDSNQLAWYPLSPLLFQSNKFLFQSNKCSTTSHSPLPRVLYRNSGDKPAFLWSKVFPIFHLQNLTFFFLSLLLLCYYCYIWLRSWEALKSSICRLVFLLFFF